MKVFENNYTTFPIMLLRHFLDFLLKMNIKIYKNIFQLRKGKAKFIKRTGNFNQVYLYIKLSNLL